MSVLLDKAQEKAVFEFLAKRGKEPVDKVGHGKAAGVGRYGGLFLYKCMDGDVDLGIANTFHYVLSMVSDVKDAGSCSCRIPEYDIIATIAIARGEDWNECARLLWNYALEKGLINRTQLG